MASAAVSPWMTKVMKNLKPQSLQGSLTPEENDGVLEGLAKQTIQPYRSGFAALPGVAASLVGGLASAELANRRQARASADEAVDRRIAGINTSPSTSARTSAVTNTQLGGGSSQTSPPASQTVPARPIAQPATSRPVSAASVIGGEIKNIENILATQPMSARKRKELMDRLARRKQQQMTLAEKERLYQRGAADRELNRKYKLAQIEQLKSKTDPEEWRLYQRALESGGFVGSYVDFVKARNAATRQASKTETTEEKEIAKAQVKTAVEALKKMPSITQAGRVLDELDKLSQKSGIESAIGPQQGSTNYQNFVGAIPFSETTGFANRDLHNRVVRLQNQLEVLGGEKMRGLGAQSDEDARRLRRAISNLTFARTKVEFQKHLDFIRTFVQSGMARAQQAARDYPKLGAQYPSLNQSPAGYRATGRKRYRYDANTGELVEQ